jgi:hypothetical protein
MRHTSGAATDIKAIFAGVFTMFRIISPDGVYLALSETVQGMVEIVRHGRPGRYHIDETGANLPTPGQSSRNWGAVIRFPNGDIAIHPHQGPV